MVTDDSGKARSQAEATLRQTADEHAAKIDPAVKKVLDLKALEEVFAVAWARQFDRDRAAVQRDLRDVVQKAVAEVVEADAD
jgi:hypothetical protein